MKTPQAGAHPAMSGPADRTVAPLKHVVITASDAHCGGFLVRHWLASLERAIDPDRVDVAVIDYGLTRVQRMLLVQRGVILWPARRDGHVTSVRLRDTAAFLACHRYDQVMVADGGDIIFQASIMDAFRRSPRSLRAVYETHYTLGFWRLYLRGFFRPSLVPVIRAALKDHQAVNTGVLLGPSEAVRRCLAEAFDLIRRRSAWGPDAVALNYLLHRDGFVPMPETCNFVLPTARRAFRIRQGQFQCRDGALIRVVHNAGGASPFRVVRRFGWGEGRNRVRWALLFCLRTLGRACRTIRSFRAAVRTRATGPSAVRWPLPALRDG
jgi:hypothetical protein